MAIKKPSIIKKKLPENCANCSIFQFCEFKAIEGNKGRHKSCPLTEVKVINKRGDKISAVSYWNITLKPLCNFHKTKI